MLCTSENILFLRINLIGALQIALISFFTKILWINIIVNKFSVVIDSYTPVICMYFSKFRDHYCVFM